MKYIIAVGLPAEGNIPWQQIKDAVCAGIDEANRLIEPFGAKAYYPDEIQITLIRETKKGGKNGPTNAKIKGRQSKERQTIGT